MTLLEPTLDTTPKRRAGEPITVTVEDLRTLDLRVAGLLAALPPLTDADVEVVAIGTVMRTRAIGEVLSRVFDTHTRPPFGADNKQVDDEVADRLLLAVWREHVAAIATRTDAVWWATQGLRGFAAVTHPPTPARRTR